MLTAIAELPVPLSLRVELGAENSAIYRAAWIRLGPRDAHRTHEAQQSRMPILESIPDICGGNALDVDDSTSWQRVNAGCTIDDSIGTGSVRVALPWHQ